MIMPDASGAPAPRVGSDRLGPFLSLDASEQEGRGGLTANGWSSLIGIVTAIVGNVLISVALNLQRYAHLRLHKEWAEERERRGSESPQNGVDVLDGAKKTTASEANGRRAVSKRRRDSEDCSLDSATETDPLIARTSDCEHDEHDGPPASRERRSPVDGQKSYLQSPYWWIGIILMVTGECGNFLAYGFAPASIVSPLGVVALVSNCVIAPFMLRERFRIRDAFGVVIAVGGAVTVVLSAKSENPKLGPDEIRGLIATWEFETYLGVTAAVLTMLMLASEKYGDKSIFIDLGIVGLCGGYTALSTKGVSSMLSYSIFRAITYPLTYVLTFILVTTAITQVKYLNRGLQRFDATQVVPTQFVLFTLSVILGSAILYRDFERTTAEDAGEFVGGCILTFAGVWLITSGRKPPSEEDHADFYDEDVDAIDLVEEEYQDEHADRVEASGQPSTQMSMPYGMNATASRRPSRLSAPTSSHPEDRPATPSSIGTRTSESAITTTDPGSLADNPWLLPQGSMESLLRRQFTLPNPPRLQSSKSEPFLPGDSWAFISRPNTLPTPAKPSATAHSHATPSVAAHAGGLPVLTPRTNQESLFRPSLTDLVAGPLTTPLSSSLSAVVVDTLRRGIDGTTMKRRRSIARARLPNMPGRHPSQNEAPSIGARGVSEADLEAIGATLGSMETPCQDGVSVGLLPEHGGDAGRCDSPGGVGRRPSVRKTLGKLFGRKKKGKGRDGARGSEDYFGDSRA